MSDTAHALPETIECPLCLGRGQLTRAEVLERLGMKDFTEQRSCWSNPSKRFWLLFSMPGGFWLSVASTHLRSPR
jgi:hypothetical protein